jgi:UDP-N-acetyl-D-glucosamine dehydrogenase
MSTAKEQLLHRIHTRQARAGVVGLGYVGLPLAVEMARSGLACVGIDVDAKKVSAISRGESYIPDVLSADVQSLLADGRLSATTDFSVVAELDTVNICVPTPLRKTKEPDLSTSSRPSRRSFRTCTRGCSWCSRSTTYPGTTEEDRPAAARVRGLKASVDFFRVLARARRSRATRRSIRATRAKGRGRHVGGVRRGGDARSTAHPSRRSCPSVPRASPRW